METCSRCINDTRNPAVRIGLNGLCQFCSRYVLSLGRNREEELADFRDAPALVGMSGGKDSTVTAYLAKSLGMNVRGFTFDTGYYPESTFPRAKAVADYLKIPHEVIDVRGYVTPEIRGMYRETADFYDKVVDRTDALDLYFRNREHYSAKDRTVMPFVRSCQICRKVVIPAYYAEAVKRGASILILGLNEWTHLSGTEVTAVRRLQPSPDMPVVRVVHLPFLLKLSSADVRKIFKDSLKSLHWKPPEGDRFIETNSNSCLFARAAEQQACNMLDFHPDSTRLAREVTCGFISRTEALGAVGVIKGYDRSVRKVLIDAGII